ncbi:hypothetical protein ACH427_04505 [Streptomyces sp. NPDC020379]|uniref:hypothetical protein n=1 Tax=Streptomyces sp. NPDC020379 TaxID=3365071 RepID=UPI00378C5536
MTTTPDLYTIDVTLYGPHFSGAGFAHVATGAFEIDLNEDLQKSDAVELLGRFIVKVRDQYEWQDYDRVDMVAGAEFPGLGMVYANGVGQEVRPG